MSKQIHTGSLKIKRPLTTEETESTKRQMAVGDETASTLLTLDEMKLPPSEVPIQHEPPSIHLISYLEKSKVKEDMRRLISAKILQLRTYVEFDYFDHREAIRRTINQHGIPEDQIESKRGSDMPLDRECVLVNQMNKLLIDVKACDNDFPDLDLLISICKDYQQILSRTMPSLYYSNEEQIRRHQDKISLCKSVLFMCEIYKRNIIWKEHLIGVWSSLQKRE